MLLAAWLEWPFLCNAQTVAVTNGSTIVFLGDSITASGGSNPDGYCRLVIHGLEHEGVKATMIPLGFPQWTSDGLRGIVDKDVIKKKPAWMTLSCGVNDVMFDRVSLERFKTNMTAMVDTAQSNGIRVMIFTVTMIGEDATATNNQKLVAYNEFLRKMAVEKKCLLADLNADMQKAVAEGRAKGQKGTVLTVDGIHMNSAGNQMMAIGVLQAFGLSDEQLTKVRESWQDIPGLIEIKSYLPFSASLTLRQQARLQTLADERKISIADLINADVDKSVIKAEVDKCVGRLLESKK
jgi:lysophospholipase L1-like esterase